MKRRMTIIFDEHISKRLFDLEERNKAERQRIKVAINHIVNVAMLEFIHKEDKLPKEKRII